MPLGAAGKNPEVRMPEVNTPHVGQLVRSVGRGDRVADSPPPGFALRSGFADGHTQVPGRKSPGSASMWST